MAALMVNQLLAHCLRNGCVDDVDIHAFLDRLSDAEFAALQALLVEILLQEEQAGNVIVTDAATQKPEVFHSMLYGTDPNANTLVAFSFTHALTEALFPLAGLIVAAASDHLGMANLAQAGGVVKALWQSLTVLRSPQDDDVINTARAIGALMLHYKTII